MDIDQVTAGWESVALTDWDTFMQAPQNQSLRMQLPTD